MKRAVKYRIHPTTEQTALFMKTFDRCRKAWNLMLHDRSDAYRKDGTRLYPTPAMYKKDYPFLKEEENGTTKTLLFCAVQSPDAKLLKTLLDEYNGSACVDVEDNEGETALDIAEALNFQEAVDLLKQYGAGTPD